MIPGAVHSEVEDMTGNTSGETYGRRGTLRRVDYDDMNLDLPIRVPGAWHREAFCALPGTSDLPWLGPEDGRGWNHNDRMRMAAVCKECPVRAECLAEAAEWTDAMFRDGTGGGFRAGMTPTQLRSFLRPRSHPFQQPPDRSNEHVPQGPDSGFGPWGWRP